MKTVLSGILPDRVPFFPTIYTDHACLACGRRFEDALINPALGTECMLNAALRYKTDAVRFRMGPDTSWYEDKVVMEQNGKLLRLSRKSGKVEGRYDVDGGGAFIPALPPAIHDINDVKCLKVMSANEYIERGCLKDVARQTQAAHEHGLFVVGMCASQTINFMVEKIGVPETALMLFYDDPKLAVALINKAVGISIERGKAFIKSGVDCLYIGDSYASASVISPDIYKRFCAPAYAEVVQEFHKLGVFCYKHCCGNYNPLLDELPLIGLDAMDGIDPTSGMSVEHTKAKIGTRLTLMGGISCLTLLNGSTETVYNEAKQCILKGMANGRYVLGSACAVPRFTPPENMVAAYTAAIENGKYK